MNQYQPAMVEGTLFLVGRKTMQRSIRIEDRGTNQCRKHFLQFFSGLVVRLLR